MSTLIIDGVERHLGCHIPVRASNYAEVFADEWKIHRAEWREVNLSAHLPPVYDQNGYGACNAYATCTVLESCRAMAGQDYARLSPGWLYGQINGQRDQGSMLEDACRYAAEVGIPEESVIPEYDWQRGKWKGKEDEALKSARKYRMLEWWQCPTVDHVVSALLRGFYVDLGVLWYSNYTPGPDGWLPRGQGSSGGHAIAGYGVARKGDVWGIRYRNSWGKNVPDGILPLSAFGGPIGGMWAARSVVFSD